MSFKLNSKPLIYFTFIMYSHFIEEIHLIPKYKIPHESTSKINL